MGVVGVPVVNSDPFELGPEIALHGRHQFAREVTQVGELDPIFGGDNEAKLVAILAARCREFLTVGRVRSRTVGLRRLAVVADPFPRDVAQVRVDRLGCHVA